MTLKPFLSVVLHHSPNTPRLILLFCLLAASVGLKAQSLGVELGTQLSFNGTDISGGFQAGVYIAPLDLSLRADFTSRLGSKRIRVAATDQTNLFYQYRETRYNLGLELEKRIRIPAMQLGETVDAGASVMIMGGYSFGDYHGTGMAPPKGLGWRARLGPYLKADETFMLRLGYEYYPLETETISDHRVFVSATFIIISQ